MFFSSVWWSWEPISSIENTKRYFHIFLYRLYKEIFSHISQISCIWRWKKTHNSFVLGRKCFVSTSSVYYYGPHAWCKIQKCQVENKRVTFVFSHGRIYFIKSKVGSSDFNWHINDHWNNPFYGVFLLRKPYRSQ